MQVACHCFTLTMPPLSKLAQSTTICGGMQNRLQTPPGQTHSLSSQGCRWSHGLTTCPLRATKQKKATQSYGLSHSHLASHRTQVPPPLPNYQFHTSKTQDPISDLHHPPVPTQLLSQTGSHCPSYLRALEGHLTYHRVPELSRGRAWKRLLTVTRDKNVLVSDSS